MNLLTWTLIVTFTVLLRFKLCTGVWWWLFQNNEEEQQQQPTAVGHAASLQKIFAPFELTEIETKFLSEASHYLGNLPKLDQCNLLIINRLKSSCNKLTEVDISKLSVNLLNCQSAVEGRRVYKCTEEMELSECTKDMDSDTWNAYHVVSNRARAVCYSVRQTEFRIKTEITINSLANSAKENLVSLQQLLVNSIILATIGSQVKSILAKDDFKESQKDLGNKTTETITQVIDGSDKAIKVQTQLKVQQVVLKEAINDNIDNLSREKQLMETRQEEIKKHSSEVKKDLEEIAGAIKQHHVARTSSDKEMLSQVQAIQTRAQDVLAKLDEAVSNMDNHYATIEQRHSRIIDNVQDIQQAINFVSEMIVNFEDSFHRQMKWINDAVGGTRDKISVISLLLGHIVQFTIMLLFMVFCGSPLLSKTTLLVLLPTNCIFALQEKQHFSYKEMFVIIALTYPANWVISNACSLKPSDFGIGTLLKQVIMKLQNAITRGLFFFGGKLKKNETGKREEEKGCEDLELTDEEEDCGESQPVVTSTPHKLFSNSINRSINRTHERLNDTSFSGNQTPRRCGSLTRTGQRCKLFCKRGSTSCSRHENSYNSYFEQSNFNS